MNKNFTFKMQYRIEASMNNFGKTRIAIISSLFVVALVIVSLSLASFTSFSAKAAQLPESQPHFNLTIAYAYVGQGPNNNYNDSNGNLMCPASLYPSAVYFNVTRLSNPENMSCDALIEVYLVTIASNRGPSENFAYFDGTNYKSSFSEAELKDLTARANDLIDLNNVDGVSGNFCFNWTINGSIVSHKVGSYGVYFNCEPGSGLWRGGQPNAISVMVNRLGYATMTDGAISVIPDAAHTNITQVQLQSYNNGFLANNIVPADQLPQINLFHPLN